MINQKNNNNKYRTFAIYAGLALCAAVALYMLLTKVSFFVGIIKTFSNVCAPIIYGYIIAYLCNPILKLYEKRVLTFKKHEKLGKKLRRPLALLLTFITAGIILTLFFVIIIPQIVKSYKELESQIGFYITAAQAYADEFVKSFPLFNGKYDNLYDVIDVTEITSNIQLLIFDSYYILEQVTNYLFEYAGKVVIEMKNIIMGIIIAIYFLHSKERLCAIVKKFFNAILSKKAYLNLVSLTRFTDKTFGGFLIGKIIDSFIIGILTFVVLIIFKMPFPPLIALIVGVTNIIPFFGPFIGAIPSAFIIFIADPGKVLWFILIIFIIQQLDGNVIGPMIIGDSTGMSSLSVLIAITIASGLFGLPGMIFGVPAGAVLCALMKQFTKTRLERKGEPVETEYYINTPQLIASDVPLVNVDAEMALALETTAESAESPAEEKIEESEN